MKGVFMEPQQAQYLRLLSIFHYVLGGITLLFSFFPVIHLMIGISFMCADNGKAGPVPFIFGLAFIVMPLIFMVFGLILGLCLIRAGKYYSLFKKHTFCLVVDAIACAFFPFGTVLGVFGIMTLTKPEVKALFDAGDVK
jgi:hypothetical protein